MIADPVDAVARYYAGKLAAHGATAAGVDWSSEASQRLRFEKLLEILGDARTFSLLDFGCGWGALLPVLDARGLRVAYTGLDASAEMVAAARARFGGRPDASFTAALEAGFSADYAVASGVFNVKLAASEERWTAHVHETLDALDAASRRGFAVNFLSLYSDPEKRRSDLYYADPLALFDRAKRRYAPRVALLHDYPLWEFTLLVRKEAP